MKRKYGLVHIPMRIQARAGSAAEKKYYQKSALPGMKWPMPKHSYKWLGPKRGAIAPGVIPDPLEDLIFHGGKIVPKMEFQNIYLGTKSSWDPEDRESIDTAITVAMRDRRLNNVMSQYFPSHTLTCDPRTSFILATPPPKTIDEPDVKDIITRLFDEGKTGPESDLGTILFNLILPSGTVLRLDTSSSLGGLGGYHGSLHLNRGGKKITLYYSANVFSEVLSNGNENGIPVFNKPWKNVVGTLYHELNEFRTDADVQDAIENQSNDFLGWTSRSGREIGDQPIFVASSLNDVFKEIASAKDGKKIPVQFMFSNAVHGAEGPIDSPHA